MVSEAPVARLFAAIDKTLSEDIAQAVATEAGHRTADYIYANRIPGLQGFLALLPKRWAVTLLSHAITKHALTFAGSEAGIGDRPDAIHLDASHLHRRQTFGTRPSLELAPSGSMPAYRSLLCPLTTVRVSITGSLSAEAKGYAARPATTRS